MRGQENQVPERSKLSGLVSSVQNKSPIFVLEQTKKKRLDKQGVQQKTISTQKIELQLIMPRPTHKKDLLALSQKNFKDLNDFIDGFSDHDKNQAFPKGTMNRNIRDVLAHLHHWHLMLLDWYTVGMKGDKPDMPAKGYTWKTTPDLNKAIWEQYQATDLKDVRKMLTDSFNAIQVIIQKHSDDELFTKKKYKWTGTTSLGAYLVSATSSHYDWALKLIKKALSQA